MESIKRVKLSDISELITRKRKAYSKKTGIKYIGNSFDTIAAYQGNAAMAHYIPEKTKSKILKNSGMLLVDTGANYLYGTTDTTRTICLGRVSNIEKKHFTIVLDAMLKLSKYKFKLGTSSKNLDKVARSALLKYNMDEAQLFYQNSQKDNCILLFRFFQYF